MFAYISHPALSEIRNSDKYNDYISIIRNIDFYSNRSKDNFSNALANEYKSLALYKAQYTNDLNDANKFALKSLTAYYGERVKPENIYLRNLSINDIVLISNNYDDLLKILSSEVQNTYPQLTADAQAKFDCWVESEEDGLTKQAKNCKERFFKTKQKLLSIIDTDCFKCKNQKKETKTTTVTKLKQFDGKHISIPKWPNMPLLRNNPPQPVIIAQDSISKDIQKINEYIKNIENTLTYIKNNQKTTQVIRDVKGKETIVVNDPNTATKSDIENIKKYLENLQSQLNELKAKNNNADFENLEQRIDELSEQIDAIEIPDCAVEEEFDDEENEYNVIDEDDYIEEEIFDAPSELLPFEIFFDWNKSDVDYKFLPQLKDISDKALSSKETIIIQGHTDTSGNSEYNQKLSDKRAKAVAKIIESYGIPSEKITLQAMGSTDLKVPTANGVKKAENRRVVIK
ncbi:MAG: OmpA family protein [Alphaproteobacteria bacterium]